MIDPLLPKDDGQTPLTPEELEGLTPSYITLRGELNEAEQINIVDHTVDDSRFISPLFIPIKTSAKWTVQYDSDWKIELNFESFWNS